MKLILVRHAIAEEPEEFAHTGEPDDLRPLTKPGSSKMKRVARGLREVIDTVDLIATSPLTRAVQTAEILAKQYKGAPMIIVPSLTPDQEFDQFLEWLRKLEDADAVVAVGHEPHMGSLAAWLLAGNGQSFFELKKGSALMLEFGGELRPGGAQLLWYLTPAQLRLIGD